jgi:hypothetical protein
VFEVIKISVFWELTAFSLFKIKRSFGGACSFHLQGRRISQVRNQQIAAFCLLHVGNIPGGRTLL